MRTRYARALTCSVVMSAMMATASVRAAEVSMPKTFYFGAAPAGAAGTQAKLDQSFSEETGFGFENGLKPEVAEINKNQGICSRTPFAFSASVPEGNYRVTVDLGAQERATKTTVKAETRRIMAEQVNVAAGESDKRTFVVNIRTPALSDGGAVKIKPREKAYLHWDHKLTLAFSGEYPSVRSITIAPAPDATTLFLAGDSTVTDQPGYTYSSWGQSLPRFLTGNIAVANYAESGESAASFLAARRFDKILSVAHPGDYLMIQFGHNDQKDKNPGAGAFTTYTANLLKMVEGARAKGITPILVTPVNRKTFGEDGKITNSLGDFPEAVRKLSADQKVPLIDLNAMSKLMYEAWGPKEAVYAFAPKDGTHHNDYGSYELAKCIVAGLEQTNVKLKEFIAKDFGGFDPAKPDARATFGLPQDNEAPTTKPDGN